ncbi:MAG: hypothetical protein C4326_09945 [Ignavibacteria bacterium]
MRLSDSTTYVSEDINGLVEDRDGFLWVAIAGGGVLRLDPRTHRFLRYVHDPSDSSTLSSNTIGELLLDRDAYL